MKFLLGSLLVVCMTLLQTATGAAIVQQTSQQTYWPRNKNAVWEPPTIAPTTKGRWKAPRVLIPYKHDEDYGMEELEFIENAMAKLSRVTGNCINYDPMEFDSQEKSFLDFRKSSNNVSPAACSSQLGRIVPDPTVTAGQTVIAFSDENNLQGSCIDLTSTKNERDFLRILMNVLGVANEYQRTDRSQVMTFSANYRNRLPDNLQSILDINTNIRNISKGFDLQSITMVDGEKYAQNRAEPPFTLKYGTVPFEAKLSADDCNALNYMYQCKIDCKDSTEFLQPTVPPTTPAPCLIQTRELTANFNCWPEGHETEQLTNAQITGDIGLVRDIIIPDCATTTDPNVLPWTVEDNFGPEIAITVNSAAPKVRMHLNNRISRGFITAGHIRVLNSIENDVFGSDNVTVRVNCLPRYTIPCDTAGACPVSDTIIPGKSELYTTATLLPTDVKGARCDDSDAVQPGSILGPFQISDPDGGIPVFSDLQVTTYTAGIASAADQVLWQWAPITPPATDKLVGNLVFLGSDSSLTAPLTVEVALKFRDTQYGVGGLKAKFKFSCSPLLRAARSRPVTSF